MYVKFKSFKVRWIIHEAVKQSLFEVFSLLFRVAYRKFVIIRIFVNVLKYIKKLKFFMAVSQITKLHTLFTFFNTKMIKKSF